MKEYLIKWKNITISVGHNYPMTKMRYTINVIDRREAYSKARNRYEKEFEHIINKFGCSPYYYIKLIN